MSLELQLFLFLDVPLLLCAVCVIAYEMGYESGCIRGRNEQFCDSFIEAGQRDRARRNNLGQFKTNRKP